MVRWLTCNPCDLYTVSADTQSEKQLYIQCVNIFFFCDTRLQRLTFHLFSRGGFSSRSTSRFSSNIIQLLVLCWNHWILFSLRKREPLSENVENVGTSVLPLPWFFFFFSYFLICCSSDWNPWVAAAAKEWQTVEEFSIHLNEIFISCSVSQMVGFDPKWFVGICIHSQFLCYK